MGAAICDFCAGTCYVSVVTRLLSVADSIQDSHQRTVAVLAYFVYTSTATFVATLRKGDEVKHNCQIRFMPQWVVLERILKGTLGIAIVLCRHIPPLYSQCDNGYVSAPSSFTSTVGTSYYDACIASRMDEGELTEVEDCPPDAGADDCTRDCTALEGTSYYLECCGGVRLGGVVLVSWAMLINLTHIYFLRRWTTCSVTFVTRLRIALLGLALFGQLITLFMILIPWDGWFLVLCIGGGLALFGLICFAIYMICFAPAPKHETEQVKQDRIDRELKKLKQKGVPPPPNGGVPPPPMETL